MLSLQHIVVVAAFACSLWAEVVCFPLPDGFCPRSLLGFSVHFPTFIFYDGWMLFVGLELPVLDWHFCFVVLLHLELVLVSSIRVLFFARSVLSCSHGSALLVSR